jgi:hypothetical protein
VSFQVFANLQKNSATSYTCTAQVDIVLAAVLGRSRKDGNC